MIAAFVEVLGGTVALLVVGLAVVGLSKVFEVRDELKRKRAITEFYSARRIIAWCDANGCPGGCRIDCHERYPTTVSEARGLRGGLVSEQE